VISQLPNKWFLRYRRNCPKLEICRRLIGKLFHKRGPATAKLLSFKGQNKVLKKTFKSCTVCDSWVWSKSFCQHWFKSALRQRSWFKNDYCLICNVSGKFENLHFSNTGQMWMCDVNDVMVCFSALWLVSSFTNNLSSMPKLDDGDNGLLSSAPPGDDDKCTGSSRETLQ